MNNAVFFSPLVAMLVDAEISEKRKIFEAGKLPHGNATDVQSISKSIWFPRASFA
jgi:hypothetical protein